MTETQIKSEMVFQGYFIKVQRDQVRLPDGQTSAREFIRHSGAAVIIPVLPNGNIIMVEQFRYPLKKVFLELPAGKKDRNEESLEAAHRELKEEVGIEAKKMEFLKRMHLAIGYSDEFIDVFLAEGFTDVGVQRDEGEFLNLIEISLEEALQLIDQGLLSDAKTLSALLFYQRWLHHQPSK